MVEIANEEDTVMLKKYGNDGDFLVYQKFGANMPGGDSGFRIAFLDQGLKKIRILKPGMGRGSQGFCLEINPVTCFDSLEKLVDYCIEDPDIAVKKQFDPNCHPRRRLLRKHSMSSPDIHSNVHQNSLDPKRYSGPSTVGGNIVKSISMPNYLNDEITTRVVSNHPNVQSLLSGKDEGSYVIHEGMKNTYKQPCNIYFVERSFKEGTPMLRIKKLHVYRDQVEGQYYLKPESDARYETLKDLIQQNKFRYSLQS